MSNDTKDPVPSTRIWLRMVLKPFTLPQNVREMSDYRQDHYFKDHEGHLDCILCHISNHLGKSKRFPSLLIIVVRSTCQCVVDLIQFGSEYQTLILILPSQPVDSLPTRSSFILEFVPAIFASITSNFNRSLFPLFAIQVFHSSQEEHLLSI